MMSHALQYIHYLKQTLYSVIGGHISQFAGAPKHQLERIWKL